MATRPAGFTARHHSTRVARGQTRRTTSNHSTPQHALIDTQEPGGELIVAKRSYNLRTACRAHTSPQIDVLAKCPHFVGIPLDIVDRAEIPADAVVHDLRQCR